MTRLVLLFMMSVLLFGGGCDTTGTSEDTATPEVRNEPLTQNPPNVDVPAANEYDKSFLFNIGQKSLGVVVMSRYAAKHSTNADVKAFAQQMGNSHNNLNVRMERLAKDKGIKLARELSAADERDFNRLKTIKGADFDRQYVEVMIRSFAAISNPMHEAAERASDRDIRSFADDNEQEVRQHSQAARQLSQKLK